MTVLIRLDLITSPQSDWLALIIVC